MKHLFLSFINAIMASICFNILFSQKSFIIQVIEYGFVSNFWDMLKMGGFAFSAFFLLLSGIAFFINCIRYIILFYYYGIFYNYDKTIHVTVNDQKAISSYVEFSNGKTIPIKIHKVVLNSNSVEKEETVNEVEQESKEE